MRNQNDKVLITGGFGFIGYHLACGLLARNYKVVIYGHRNARTGPFFYDLQKKHKDTIELKEGELDEMEMHDLVHSDREINVVFHLAAKKATTKTIGEIQDILAYNFDVDSTVMDYCDNIVAHNVAEAIEKKVKFIYISTGEVYGATFQTGKAMEEEFMCTIDPTDPKYMYPMSKLYTEMSLNNVQQDFYYNIVRLQNPYGPLMDDRMLLPTIIRKSIEAKEGGHASIDIACKDTRPYVYITDVVNGLIEVHERGINGHTYNLAGDEVNIGQLAMDISHRYADGNLLVLDTSVNGGDHRRMNTLNIKNQCHWEQNVSINRGVALMHEFYLKHDIVDRAMKNMGL